MAVSEQALLGLVLFALVLSISSADESCPNNFFNCNNGRCIASFFVCDDDNDCGNLEDELNCFANDTSSNDKASHSSITFDFKCPQDHFSCGDLYHSCLPQRWVCNGMKECANGADESNCTTIDCGDDFRCASGKECISEQWVCDGHLDCFDNSDEINCTSIKSIEVICDREHGKYRCASGECIEYSKQCDGKKDCLMGDDEGVQCHLHSCTDKKCSHICAQDPVQNSTFCLCPSGFQLKNGTTCVDFDECSDNKLTNMCSQRCINLEGSHRCECDIGYTLVNQTQCIVQQGSVVLFYSFDDQIRSYYVKENRVSETFTGSPGEIISELEVDIFERKLYYISSKYNSHGTVYEAEFDGDFRLGTPKAIMIHDKLSGLEGISVDYATGNLYLTDSERDSIVVCKTNPTMCVTLIKNCKSPRAIVVLPQRGHLYWTQWGDKSFSGIYQAQMDGSNVSLLIGNLTWPNGLTYDDNRNRLYWTDGKHGKIEYYDFDIELRHHVYEDHNRQPYSIHVFEDNLYWSDWAKEELMIQDKITGHNLRPLIYQSVSRFLGLALYHPLLQKRSFNPCSLEPCSHLCLMKTPTEHTCSCPDHMNLINDSECQVLSNESYILASTGRRLYKFYTSEISNSHSEEVPLPSRVHIGELTYDTTNQRLYIFDVRSATLGFISHNRGRLRYEKLVSEDLRMPTSLRYEPNSGSLYWTDYILGTVEVFSTEKKQRLTIINEISKPISLAIDPPNRLMYIGARSHPARIYSAYLDGSSARIIMQTHMNGIPIAMVKRFNTLVWADPTFSKIEEIQTLGSGVMGSPKKLNLRSVGAIHSLDSYNGTLFWTDADSSKVFYSTPANPSSIASWRSSARVFTRNLPMTEYYNTEDVRLVVVQKNDRSLPDCSAESPKCPHLCLVGQRGQVCRCANGFTSKDNGQTCVQDREVHAVNAYIPLSFFNSSSRFLLFQSDQQEIPDDDYITFTDNSNYSSSQTPISAPTVIEIEQVQVGPKHSPWKFIGFFLFILILFIVFSWIQFPNFRETVINIRLSPSVLNRNVSATRFFRNPACEIGVVTNEQDMAIDVDQNTQIDCKYQDTNANLLL